MVQSAMRLFAQKGYAATTVAEIEGDVGLRPGSGGLYRHFASKDELLLAAVSDYHLRVQSIRRRLADEAAGAGRGVAADLRHLVAVLGGFLAEEQAMVQLGSEAWALPEVVRRALDEAWDDGYGMFTDLFIRHGVPEGEAQVLALSALGSITHYATHIGSWGSEPCGVPFERYLDAWVAQFSALAERVPDSVG
jgi:AcrR family transcriptional regulator